MMIHMKSELRFYEDKANGCYWVGRKLNFLFCLIPSGFILNFNRNILIVKMKDSLKIKKYAFQ